MTIIEFQHLLAWCLGINYAILIVWFTVFVYAHEALYRLHRRWFNLSLEAFDAVNYAGMAIYKIGVMLFFLVPWLALLLMAK